jgi:hypothetical protein
MIVVQEVHDVAGRDEDAFDLALRDSWAPALAESGEARLVWALRQAHGTGASYRVITYTAVRSAEAWGRLAERIAGGDLRAVVDGLDRYRHGATASLLRPVSWSPLQEIDLEAVPEPDESAPASLFMEDTAYPFREHLEDYLAQAGQLYAGMLAEGAERGTSMLEMVAAFQPLWGTGPWRQVVLWRGSPTRTTSWPCSPWRSRPSSGPPGPGCTTRWSCGTSGRAASCARSPGHPCAERRSAFAARLAAFRARRCWRRGPTAAGSPDPSSDALTRGGGTTARAAPVRPR